MKLLAASHAASDLSRATISRVRSMNSNHLAAGCLPGRASFDRAVVNRNVSLSDLINIIPHSFLHLHSSVEQSAGITPSVGTASSSTT